MPTPPRKTPSPRKTAGKTAATKKAAKAPTAPKDEPPVTSKSSKPKPSGPKPSGPKSTKPVAAPKSAAPKASPRPAAAEQVAAPSKATPNTKPQDDATAAQAAFADPAQWSEFMAEWGKITQEFWTTAVQKYTETDWLRLPLDPYNLRGAWGAFLEGVTAQPERLQDAQSRLMEQYSTLWTETMKRLEGQDYEEIIPHDPSDKRFKSEKWHELVPFDFIRQSYLIAAEWLRGLVRENSQTLDEREARKLAFFTEQTLNALSPSNFAATNPEVLEETVRTGGQNLIRGFHNLLNDIRRSHQLFPAIKTTDEAVFKPGENIAITRGDVVLRTPMMELVQYAPATDKVYKTPLLIIPPWINKYYILDLRPENSLIKWAVDQGHQVFILSWVNPGRDLADKNFDAYMQDGILTALDAALDITGAESAHLAGYCIGGTLLSMTLAWMAANKQDHKVKTATFLTTLIDFEQAGDLRLFTDEEQIKHMENTMKEKGFLDSEALKTTFSMLRSNDLIWSFVVNNYLMGKEPLAFDLLFWNNDSTNLPAAMHSTYLRHMYLQNDLIKPGCLALKGTPIDLRKVKTPSYFLSAREDHIAPWLATYDGVRHLGGERTFTLAGSGHIAGVVNPPIKKKYGFWANTALPDKAADWQADATYTEGSWWPHWHQWLDAKAPAKTAAPKATGSKAHPPLCPAPGQYVLMR